MSTAQHSPSRARGPGGPAKEVRGAECWVPPAPAGDGVLHGTGSTGPQVTRGEGPHCPQASREERKGGVVCKLRPVGNSPGGGAQLVTASIQDARAAGSSPHQGTNKNPPVNESTNVSGTANQCSPLSPSLSLLPSLKKGERWAPVSRVTRRDVQTTQETSVTTTKVRVPAPQGPAPSPMWS